MMRYFFYIEQADYQIHIEQFRDEFHYLDTLYIIESEAQHVPYDIRWHGDDVNPPMRILAISQALSDLGQSVHEIIAICGLELRQN